MKEIAVVWSKGILADHRPPKRNRGRKSAKNEAAVFSLLKRWEGKAIDLTCYPTYHFRQ